MNDLLSRQQRQDVDVLQRLVGSRFACRAYLPEPVPGQVIHGIVGLARHTASWCNVQPWELVIASGERMEQFRAALVAHAKAHPGVASDLAFPPAYEGVYAQRRREAGFALYNALGITRDDVQRRNEQSAENFRMFGAPHVAIVSIPERIGPYAAVDAGGFVANFLMAAHAHGVATIAQAALAMHAGFVRGFFGIPDSQHMVCAISFGYADRQHPANSYRTSRAAVDELLRFA